MAPRRLELVAVMAAETVGGHMSSKRGVGQYSRTASWLESLVDLTEERRYCSISAKSLKQTSKWRREDQRGVVPVAETQAAVKSRERAFDLTAQTERPAA